MIRTSVPTYDNALSMSTEIYARGTKKSIYFFIFWKLRSCEFNVQCIERAKQNKETTPLQESKQPFDFAGTDSFNHTPTYKHF